MCRSCSSEIDKVWQRLDKEIIFRTPDLMKGKNFSINQIDNNKIIITPQEVVISKKSFIDTLHYLNQFRHGENNLCKISSSNDLENMVLCASFQDKQIIMSGV